MKTLVDKVKSGARTLAVGAAIGLASLAYSPKVAEAHETNPTDGFAIHSFKDFVDGSVPKKTVQSSVDPSTHLKVLDTVIPASIVEEGSHWYAGFINYVENPSDPNLIEAKVVGYAENRWSSTTGFEGYMWGKYLGDSNHLQEGEKPEDIYFVHDGEVHGIGYIKNGNWLLGSDDKFYYSKDVMFGPNKVYGDVNELPIFVGSGVDYLPEMIVDDRFIRTGPAGMKDLVDLTENWLSQDCHPYNNADCSGADWDFNGQVNFTDFSYMTQGWDPNYVTSPRTGPAGMGELEALSENWLRQDCQLYGVNSCDGADWDFDGDVDLKDFSHMANGWDPSYVAPMSASSSSSLENSVLLESSEVYSTVQDESGVYVADSVESNVPYTSESNSSYLIKTIVKGGEVIATFE